MNRKQVLEEVTELLDYYCEECFVKQTFKKEHGKNYAQSFCIKNCTIGEKIKQYGDLLLKK
ncbi:zinc-finger domain-containing protein [Bacillus sp. CGMCC 1.16541]|uniref:zinc-finger domain-containing protein n=1 Tax=Bacillus sp. CGMCC 1.16541 TaxID=2185143 RepID=UPI000D73EDFF|nr:zinc-finger domain-containing protein [Bacillus sp. CGMCC 1.16541]